MNFPNSTDFSGITDSHACLDAKKCGKSRDARFLARPQTANPAKMSVETTRNSRIGCDLRVCLERGSCCSTAQHEHAATQRMMGYSLLLAAVAPGTGHGIVNA